MAPSSGEEPVVVVALEVTWWEFVLVVGFGGGPVTEEVLSEIAYQFVMGKAVVAELAEIGGALVGAAFGTESYVVREPVES